MVNCHLREYLTEYTNYRVAQINPYKFQMVRNTHTKRNGNIFFIQVIAKIHISQNMVLFDKSTKITEWSKQKEMPLLNHAARASNPRQHSKSAETPKDDCPRRMQQI